jgi:putative sigma-54 modulation protein
VRIKGSNCEVDDRLRADTEKKVEHLTHFFPGIISVDVEFSQNSSRRGGGSRKVEITLGVSGGTLRCEESGTSFRSSFDVALGKVKRQLSKRREKLYQRSRAGKNHAVPEEIEKQIQEEAAVANVSRFNIKPMTQDEAVTQMNLLGRDFYVFMNAESNQINALYKQHDGGIALMIPDA